MIGLRSRRDAPRDVVGIDVPGVGLDVGEHGRGAGVENGVGGGDERVRRADHFVAGADAGDDRAPDAAPSCTTSSRRRDGRRRGRRTAPRTAATFGPWLTQPLASTSATARASASSNSGRESGISCRRRSRLDRGVRAATRPPGAQPFFEARRVARNPSCSRAASTEASRRDTGFTLRGGRVFGP